MIAAVAELRSRIETISWIPCASHKLQLCIHHALDRSPAAKTLFSKCQVLSKHIKNHTEVRRQVELTQKERFKKSRRMIIGNETRWNSHFEMGKRVVENHSDIVATIPRLPQADRMALAERNLPLSDDEVSHLGNILSITKK